MIVKELIEKLQQYPEDAEVITTSSNFELNYSLVPVISVYACKLKKVKKTFIDAFDYLEYEKTVYVPDESGETCVKIY